MHFNFGCQPVINPKGGSTGPGRYKYAMFRDLEVIFSYTRRQAIEDGVLVDVSKVAKEAGFKIPVAVTSAVWNEIVKPDEAIRGIGQSEEGRLWDVLWMCRNAAVRSKTSVITFQLYAVFTVRQLRKRVALKRRRQVGLRRGKEEYKVAHLTKLFALKAVCGPGDEAEPVITIMMPGED